MNTARETKFKEKMHWKELGSAVMWVKLSWGNTSAGIGCFVLRVCWSVSCLSACSAGFSYTPTEASGVYLLLLRPPDSQCARECACVTLNLPSKWAVNLNQISRTSAEENMSLMHVSIPNIQIYRYFLYIKDTMLQLRIETHRLKTVE